jgi:hypothetical protein
MKIQLLRSIIALTFVVHLSVTQYSDGGHHGQNVWVKYFQNSGQSFMESEYLDDPERKGRILDIVEIGFGGLN